MTVGRFHNKCALVTGAAGGIGQAIVSRLRAEGARLAVADRNTDNIDAEVCLPGDLTDPDYCDSLSVDAFDALGGLDILVKQCGVHYAWFRSLIPVTTT